MAWGTFGDAKTSSSAGFVLEGNVKKFKFTEQAQRVRFLTEDVDIEQIMSEKHIGRDEAEDFVMRNIAPNKWIMPKSFWEHSIKSIPNQRFFSTVFCLGKNKCTLCAENDKVRAMGTTENKMLPYPVRKRFLVPVWVYDLKQVLYLIGSEDYLNTIARYIDKHGSNIDFEVSKRGKGFDTSYDVIFLGKSEEELPADIEILKPSEVDMYCGDEELQHRITGERKQNAEFNREPNPVHGEEPKQSFDDTQTVPKTETKEFVMPFGTHKGKTLKEIEASDGIEYVKFLAENSVGAVQAEAEKYINSKM